MCSVDDCTKDVYTRGFCQPHYRKFLKDGTIVRIYRENDPNSDFKTCPVCDETKHRLEFHLRPSRPDGNSWSCIDCERQYSSNRMTIRRYGVSLEEKQQMLENQGGKCAICPTMEPGSKGWNIDHNHETGHVRGLLCFNCNFVVGMVENGWEVFIPAIEAYLVAAYEKYEDAKEAELEELAQTNGHSPVDTLELYKV